MAGIEAVLDLTVEFHTSELGVLFVDVVVSRRRARAARRALRVVFGGKRHRGRAGERGRCCAGAGQRRLKDRVVGLVKVRV
jgi:hypothetical protein